MIDNVRKSNFELLRIICMIMIVTLHTLGHGGALGNTEIHSWNFYIVHLLHSLSIVAVNCYVLISGFFGVNSEFKLKKVFNLYIQALFYSIVIGGIFWITRTEIINKNSIMRTICPITMQTWWFMSVFLVLYLFTPYINKLLKSLSLKEFNRLLIILVAVFILWPSLPKFIPIDNQGGFSLYSFIVLYTVGAYISIFYKDRVIDRRILMSIYIGSSIILTIFNVSISRLMGSNWGWYSYNFILIFISSVSLFLFFKEINIKSNLINKLSSLTLGVYLIHDHWYVRQFIYKALGYEKYFNSNKFVLYTLMIIGVIYISASIIEYIRKNIFNYMIKPSERFIKKNVTIKI